MKRFMKQIGQGMTEYIIIVALIAIAAIGIYTIFGDTITTQMGNMTTELAGGSATAITAPTVTNATSQKTMSTFVDSN